MSPDEVAIRRGEDERYDAVRRGDVDAFVGYCHPELLYTHSSGTTDSLDSYAGKLRSGYYVYHSIDHPITRIVIDGDTALVLGEMNADITSGGVPKRLHNLALAVWVRSGSEWKLLAYHPTPLR
jgi:ketosteroid isomerase-like protein